MPRASVATNRTRMRQKLQQLLENLRLRLASTDAQWSLALLGLISGVLSGLVIILFRLLIELPQASLLDGQPENYEALDLWLRFALPVAGGLVIGLALQALDPASRPVGVVHVMERLAYHQGYLRLPNALVQFFGGAASVIAGHSVGREGPGVHLGAAVASLLGQRLHLPNNSIRTLVACGVAGSIAASFNTPLAGVVFAMEVVMLEYTLAGFAPVILAAVSATAISRIVFGSEPAFSIPPLELAALTELPYVLIMGLMIGALAAAFIYALQRFGGLLTERPVWQRCTLGGLAVGLIAIAVPEVMSIGYDTVNSALLGELTLALMLIVTLAKLVATSAVLGLGLPGGLIGPTLVIGATAGGAFGILAEQFLPGEVASPGLYALIGMGAMMGATLQAPLAALTAMLELTGNPNIIMPGMLALIGAGLISSEVFNKRCVFVELMRIRGLDYRNDPILQARRRIGVASAMDRSFAELPAEATVEDIKPRLENEPRWILIRGEERKPILLAAADLVRQLQDQKPETSIKLLEIPGERHELASIHMQASMQEAVERLNAEQAQALFVTRPVAPGIEHVYGVLTREAIDRSYRL